MEVVTTIAVVAFLLLLAVFAIGVAVIVGSCLVVASRYDRNFPGDA